MRDRLLDFGWGAASRGIGLAICIGIVYFATAILNQVPCWLGQWWPSVVVQDAHEAFRDHEHGAFVLTNFKAAPGDILTPIFHVEATGNSYSPPLGLSVHRCRPDNSRINEPFRSHDVGTTWQTRYCFEMPGTIAPSDPLHVTGFLVHRRWFGVVHEPVPAFEIGAM